MPRMRRICLLAAAGVAGAFAALAPAGPAHAATITVTTASDVVNAADGLTSLRDRVASVGGERTLDSPPGAGTSIRAEIPCAS